MERLEATQTGARRYCLSAATVLLPETKGVLPRHTANVAKEQQHTHYKHDDFRVDHRGRMSVLTCWDFDDIVFVLVCITVRADESPPWITRSN